jgi:DNA-binding NarL/FixJ family response regulator
MAAIARQRNPHKETTTMIRILLVDENPYVVDALQTLVDVFPGFTVAAHAATGEEALALLPGLEVDVALFDLALPGMTGIDAIAAACHIRPELPTIILSAHNERSYVQRALAVGARGYITKEAPLDIVTGIERVLAGEIYLSEELRS